MWPFWGFFLPTHYIFHPQCIMPANLPSIINANVSGKKTQFANLPLKGAGGWDGGEHRGTLCSHLIFLESSLWRKKEERKNVNVYVET